MDETVVRLSEETQYQLPAKLIWSAVGLVVVACSFTLTVKWTADEAKADSTSNRLELHQLKDDRQKMLNEYYAHTASNDTKLDAIQKSIDRIEQHLGH